MILAALSVGLFAAGIPSEFAELQTPCPTPVCTTGQLPAAGLQALTDLGLSPRFYAAITVAMDIVFAAGYALIGTLIFWRRSDDRVAVFASVALLLFGTATFGFTMPALAADHPAFQIPVALLHFLGAACFGLFLYLFPDGRFVPPWTRWMATAWIGWQLAEHIFPAWTTDPRAWQLVVESIVWFGALGTVIYSQIHRYRHAPTAVQRQQNSPTSSPNCKWPIEPKPSFAPAKPGWEESSASHPSQDRPPTRPRVYALALAKRATARGMHV